MSEPIFSALTGKNNFCVSGASSPVEVNGTYVLFGINGNFETEVYVNENNYAIGYSEDEDQWVIGPFIPDDVIWPPKFINFSVSNNFYNLGDIMNDPNVSGNWEVYYLNGVPQASGSISISNC